MNKPNPDSDESTNREKVVSNGKTFSDKTAGPLALYSNNPAHKKLFREILDEVIKLDNHGIHPVIFKKLHPSQIEIATSLELSGFVTMLFSEIPSPEVHRQFPLAGPRIELFRLPDEKFCAENICANVFRHHYGGVLGIHLVRIVYWDPVEIHRQVNTTIKIFSNDYIERIKILNAYAESRSFPKIAL